MNFGAMKVGPELKYNEKLWLRLQNREPLRYETLYRGV